MEIKTDGIFFTDIKEQKIALSGFRLRYKKWEDKYNMYEGWSMDDAYFSKTKEDIERYKRIAKNCQKHMAKYEAGYNLYKLLFEK